MALLPLELPISFTLGEDVAGTFLGLTAPEFGVGSDAEELGSGGLSLSNSAEQRKIACPPLSRTVRRLSVIARSTALD